MLFFCTLQSADLIGYSKNILMTTRLLGWILFVVTLIAMFWFAKPSDTVDFSGVVKSIEYNEQEFIYRNNFLCAFHYYLILSLLFL